MTEKRESSMLKYKKGKNAAFTLIELLVVIAIIAMLLAILLPSLRKAKDQVRTIICRSNLKQWGVFFYLYAQDNNGNFMYGGEPTPDGPSTWLTSLYSYYKDGGEKMRICPEATRTAAEGEANPAKTAWEETFYGEKHRNSYAINNWIYRVPANKNNLWELQNVQQQSWMNINQTMGYKVPMFLEGWRMGGGPDNRGQAAPPDDQRIYNTRFGRFCINRHNGYVNVCFLDSSVGKVGLKQLWDLRWHREWDMTVPTPAWPPWMTTLRD